MSYSLTVFLTDQSPLTVELLAKEIQSWYPDDPSVLMQIYPEGQTTLAGDPSILLQYPIEEDDTVSGNRTIENKWVLRIWFLTEFTDPEYLEFLIGKAANHPDHLKIAACRRWLYFAGDEDPNVNYFNDCLYVTHAIESFPGVYIYDENMEEFLPQRGDD
ncbi:MAG: hypothetical protein JWN14_1610 [Chthonomonadales bacterium]|nr:hypothetical protein [Chthonomonadales bacterium]